MISAWWLLLIVPLSASFGVILWSVCAARAWEADDDDGVVMVNTPYHDDNRGGRQ